MDPHVFLPVEGATEQRAEAVVKADDAGRGGVSLASDLDGRGFSGKRRKPAVLVAFDRRSERERFSAELAGRGYAVLAAADGDAAWDLVQRRHPDLVVSDILLSRLDGYELVHRIRSQADIAATRVILCSAAFTGGEAETLAAALGVARFVAKPVPPEALPEVVAAVLAESPPTPPPATALARLESIRQRLVIDKLVEKNNALEEEIAARRESEEVHRAFFEFASVGMSSVDVAGRFLRVNRRYCEITGYRAEDLLGRTFGQVTHAEDRAGEQAVFGALVNGDLPEVIYEKRVVRPDGSVRWVVVNGRLVHDREGRPAYTVGVVQDITERKQTEQGLRESERRFAGIVRAAMDAIVSIDAEQRIVLFNRTAEMMFRCPAVKALGGPVERFMPERFRAAHREHVQRFLAAGVTMRAMGSLQALRGLRADGEEFPIEASISKVDVGGSPLATVIVRDMTERQRLQDALLDANRELERRVGERTAELARANEALLTSNEELRQFAFIASHDLQTPLRAIAGCAQLLHKGYAGQLDGRGEDLIRRLVEATHRLQVLIRDVLEYSDVETKARPFLPTDLNEVFRTVLATLAPVLRERGGEVSAGELPTVFGDRGQLAQVLLNLIDNGLKYHDTAPPRVEIRAEPEGPGWRISVRDNGIGIAAEHQERIFDIFARLHTAQAYPGTGIGLAICRRIVERHGGRLWVESAPGRGSVFHFTLPASTGEPAS